MRPKGAHSFSDRLTRANIDTLSDQDLRIAILADSPNSASNHCRTSKIYGPTRIQICAVAQILRDFPEQILLNPNNLAEMQRLKDLISVLPDLLRKEVEMRLDLNQ